MLRELPVIRALLARNADPTLVDIESETVLMYYVKAGRNDCIACLLEDRRVVASINARSTGGERWSALHMATIWGSGLTTILLLLQAGADFCLRDWRGYTPLQTLRSMDPGNEAAKAVLEEAMDAKRAVCILMIRRQVVAQPGTVELLPDEGGFTEEEQEWRRLAAFVVGVGEGCTKDTFTVVMDFLLPRWSLLYRAMGQQVVMGQVGG